VSNRIAVCPGSYDPVTLGHVDIIRRAAAMFDHVVVGVVRRPKHKEPLIPAEDRVALLEESLADVPNASVAMFSDLVVEFARREGACALVKGLRAVSDFEWEFQMQQLNKHLAPEIETLYLAASGRYMFVSSSGVREIASFGGSIEDLVPPCVVRWFKDHPSSRTI
jgi:pantetheine-phosphate adenylyltransferase